MKRRILGPGLTAAIATIALTACGPVDVTIVAELGEGADAQPLNALEVQVLPYDRDQIFDSLAAAASRPEPPIPPDLMAARDEIAQARTEWRDAENRWVILRDTLTKLSEELEDLDPGMRLYNELFLQWEDFNIEYEAANRVQTDLFERFTDLQSAAIGRMDSINFQREQWAAEAFVEVDAVIGAKIEMSGLVAVYDTTEAAGSVQVQVPPGDYWVHARYELPDVELYWNVPITVVRGEPLVVRLTRENAESRPIF